MAAGGGRFLARLGKLGTRTKPESSLGFRPRHERPIDSLDVFKNTGLDSFVLGGGMGYSTEPLNAGYCSKSIPGNRLSKAFFNSLWSLKARCRLTA